MPGVNQIVSVKRENGSLKIFTGIHFTNQKSCRGNLCEFIMNVIVYINIL